ncbi:MAG TPA: spore coat U domain-containing protein [Rhizomicrobium sp.]|jgi:spore coat protein U-like protein
MRGRYAFVVFALLLSQSAQAICVPSLGVSATELNFGVYDPGAASANTSMATITLQCAVGLLPSFSVALSPGGSGSYAMRRMTNGSAVLSYNFYTDPNDTVVWGDGSGTTSTDSSSGLLSLGATSFTVYGSVPRGQYPAPGSFADEIMVTVTY